MDRIPISINKKYVIGTNELSSSLKRSTETPYVESEVFKARWLNLRETTHYKIETDRMIVQQDRARQVQLEEDKKAAKQAAKEAEEKRIRDEEEAKRKAMEEQISFWRKEFEENENGGLFSGRKIDRRERIENARWARERETG
jgi:hypothetical protein